MNELDTPLQQTYNRVGDFAYVSDRVEWQKPASRFCLQQPTKRTFIHDTIETTNKQ